ncbi:MAG: hypothetical protein KAI47_14730 [Deltaproteobacteria bacterium]|nr:hypothetical protein [Deltaproteobacteria bacterium]
MSIRWAVIGLLGFGLTTSACSSSALSLDAAAGDAWSGGLVWRDGADGDGAGGDGAPEDAPLQRDTPEAGAGAFVPQVATAELIFSGPAGNGA